MTDTEILKTANLLKRSRNRTAMSVLGGTNWQLRRITLTCAQISYSVVDGPVKGFFPINSTTKCENIAAEQGKDYAFRVSTGNDELVLNASNSDNRQEWIEAIRAAPGFSSSLSLSACNAEEVMDLAAEMDRVRVEKERLAQQQVQSLSNNKDREEQREQQRKKVAQDLAEKKRREAALLLIREAEAAAALAALVEKVRQPVRAMRKQVQVQTTEKLELKEGELSDKKLEGTAAASTDTADVSETTEAEPVTASTTTTTTAVDTADVSETMEAEPVTASTTTTTTADEQHFIYMCVDAETGKLLYGNTEQEVNSFINNSSSNADSSSGAGVINIAAQVQSVEVKQWLGEPNFALVFKQNEVSESDQSDLQSNPKLHFEVSMPVEDSELCAAFVTVLRDCIMSQEQ